MEVQVTDVNDYLFAEKQGLDANTSANGIHKSRDTATRVTEDQWQQTKHCEQI